VNKLTSNLHESNDILHSPYKRIDWKTYLDGQHWTGHLVLVELIQSGIVMAPYCGNTFLNSLHSSYLFLLSLVLSVVYNFSYPS
jgi:hypothetical protein